MSGLPCGAVRLFSPLRILVALLLAAASVPAAGRGAEPIPSPPSGQAPTGETAAAAQVPAPRPSGPPPASLPPAECVRLLRAARIAGMKGDPAAELARLREAVETFPDEIIPLNALLEFHRRQPLPEAEHRRLRELLLARLGDPGLMVPPGVLEQLARDPGADEETLQAMAQSVAAGVGAGADPDPRLLAVLAELQQRLGRDEAAFDTWRRLWRASGSELAVAKLLALGPKLERWPEVIELLHALIERGAPGLRRFYVLALADAGRFDEALAQIDVAVAEEGSEMAGVELPQIGAAAGGNLVAGDRPGAGTEMAGLLTEVAWSLRDAGRDQEAERLFRRALALAPDDPELLAVLLHLYGTEEQRQAQTDVLAQRWKKETNPRALLDEGTQRLAAGDAAGALDLLARAAPEYPDLEAPWYNLGIAAFKLREWATAEGAYRRAAEINPARADSFYFRGVALTYLERCGEATAALERALELDPGRRDAHYHLAACYRKLGDPNAADRHRRLYEEAVRQNRP